VTVIHAYARVSTTDQTTRLQLDALARVRPDHVWDECGSGADATRPRLAAMLEALQPGDEVVVWKLDRLARSLRHLLVIIDTVTSAGASLRSLTEPIDTASALGRMMLQLLGSFAEFERGMILERCSAGRAAAMDRGVIFGRKRTVDRDMVQLCLDEGLTQAETARRMGCTRASICRLLREGIVFQAFPPRPPSGKQAAPRCQPFV
jgi:DNA invertase Pin-like site-specific DNA recombinase